MLINFFLVLIKGTCTFNHVLWYLHFEGSLLQLPQFTCGRVVVEPISTSTPQIVLVMHASNDSQKNNEGNEGEITV